MVNFPEFGPIQHAIYTWLVNRFTSSSDLEEVITIFQAVDGDGDGVLSQQEMTDALTQLLDRIALQRRDDETAEHVDTQHLIDSLLQKFSHKSALDLNFSEFTLMSINPKSILTIENLD